MAIKKRGAAGGVDLATMRGQTFCIAGKLAGWNAARQIAELVAQRGGKIVKAIDGKLNYLITGRTGFAAAKKQAEKLNAQGKATVQIIDEAAFFALAAPTREEAIALLKGGNDEIYLMEQWTRSCAPHLPDLKGADLRTMRLPDDNIHTSLEQLNLEGADFRGAYLVAVHFGNLVGANLDKAHFHKCTVNLNKRFERCTIRKASCRYASFSIANISASDFSGSDLTNADFRQARGDSPRFENSTLAGAEFKYAKIKQANFTKADLKGADLSESEFPETNFTRADLRRATLTGADLRQADFSGADLRDADLTAADLRGAKFHGAKLAGACLQFAQVDPAALDEARDVSSQTVDLGSRVGPKQRELEQVVQTARSVTLELAFRRDKQETKVQINANQRSARANWGEWNVKAERGTTGSVSAPTLTPVLVSLAHRFRDSEFEFDALSVKSTKSNVAGKALRRLALEAWCEASGVPVPDEQAAQSQKQSRQAYLAEVREGLLTLLRGGRGGVEKWNDLSDGERTQAGHFRGVDLSRAKLAGATLRSLDFRKAVFNKANLSKSHIGNADLREAELTGARLDGADASAANFQNAILERASCQGAQLTTARFEQANLRNANLTKANLQRANLRGADLTDALLDGANLEGATYDEATKWPAGFTDFSNLKWSGQGPNPALAQAKQERAAGGPIDLPTFLKRLEAEVDPARLQKALSMLKADRFRLFAEVQPDSVVGVVKSQTDPDLVYSCRLAADGTFACCTQNLNICGGLRGALCKHLLVLLIGLTQAEQLDPTTVDQWIAASRLQKPLLQKERMSETFLRYKGAEAGEIDWRPTETIPEDYYAV